MTGLTADGQTALSAIVYRASIVTVRSTQINSYQKKNQRSLQWQEKVWLK